MVKENKQNQMVDNFIKSLKKTPKTGSIFNPWYDHDPDNDLNKKGASIRRQHLGYYLKQRVGRARFLMIAEAVGYQGGHFSGVAMTSERILLGYQKHKNIQPHYVFEGKIPQRTSNPKIKPKGFVEPTATIVWASLLGAGLNPYEFVLWNTVPWHPYLPDHPKGMLTNRTPLQSELEYSQPFLNNFIQLFPNCFIIAIGKKCEATLNTMDIACESVRHPANGGATLFKEQTLALLRSKRL